MRSMSDLKARTHNNRVLSIDFYVTYSKYACLYNTYLKPSSEKKVANEHMRVYIKEMFMAAQVCPSPCLGLVDDPCTFHVEPTSRMCHYGVTVLLLSTQLLL
jgi:hypothetical protein